MSVALVVLGCSSPDAEPDAGTDTGGTGTGGAMMGGSGGTGGSVPAGGTPSGGAGSGGSGAVGGSAGGASATGGAPATGGTGGTGGGAGTPSGGAGASGAGAGGASGSGGMAGNGSGGVAGAGRGGAGGAGTGGAGAGGMAGAGASGGTPNCASRTGGAIVDFRVCNQTMRFWITNGAFITEAIRLRGNGQSRIACFPQPQDGRDCDPVLTYHANPSNPYWTDFELETYFTCPNEVESDKDFWLGQVGQFCGQMTSVTAVDDNR